MDIFSLFAMGGPVVAVLVALSVLGLAAVFYKIVQLHRFSRAGLDKIDGLLEAWRRGKTDAAAALGDLNDPMAQLLAQGIAWLADDRIREEQVREELVRSGNGIMSGLRSLLRFLEQLAYLAPLLGLLGTVLGIIGVFQGLAAAGQGPDAVVLAGGIWEALLTTAVGLCVAIPFAFIHNALESRVNTIQARFENQLSCLFTRELFIEHKG